MFLKDLTNEIRKMKTCMKPFRLTNEKAAQLRTQSKRMLKFDFDEDAVNC